MVDAIDLSRKLGGHRLEAKNMKLFLEKMD